MFQFGKFRAICQHPRVNRQGFTMREDTEFVDPRHRGSIRILRRNQSRRRRSKRTHNKHNSSKFAGRHSIEPRAFRDAGRQSNLGNACRFAFPEQLPA